MEEFLHLKFGLYIYIYIRVLMHIHVCKNAKKGFCLFI